MKVKTLVQAKEGVMQFEADLTQEEFGFIFTFGLNQLIAQGAIADKFLSPVEEKKSEIFTEETASSNS